LVTETLIKCSREAETHGGPLRNINDEWVCQKCYDREHGIERKKAEGRPVNCPKCGAELMIKFRGGRVSISSLSMRGGKGILKCECGYEKVITNPFGGNMNRDESARRRLREEGRRAKMESRREYRATGEST